MTARATTMELNRRLFPYYTNTKSAILINFMPILVSFYHENVQSFLQTTGSTLSARARAQINIVVLQNSDFSGLDKVKNTTVPLLWFDEGLDELGDELRSEIAKAVEDPPVYKGYVLIGLGCLVGVVVAVGTISAVMTCRYVCNYVEIIIV